MFKCTVLRFAKNPPTQLGLITPSFVYLPIIEDKVMEEESSLHFSELWSWAEPGATTERCKPLACPLACALVYINQISHTKLMRPWTSLKKKKKSEQSPEGWLSTNGIMVRTINNQQALHEAACLPSEHTRTVESNYVTDGHTLTKGSN